MVYSSRKTATVIAVIAIASATVFSAHAESGMDAGFQSQGAEGFGAGFPDMSSGGSALEMPSDFGSNMSPGSSVEMPQMGNDAGDMSMSGMGDLSLGEENGDTPSENKKEEGLNQNGGLDGSSNEKKENNPFSSLAGSVVENLSFDADGYLSQIMGDAYKGIDSSLYNMEMPNVSFQDLNTQFAQMKASMDLKTSTISMELPDFSLNTTSASNARDLFSQTYGNITSKAGTKKLSIPSDFDTSSFLKKGFSAQASAKNQFKKSSAFKNTNNYLGGLSSIVSDASKKLSTKSAYNQIGKIKSKISGHESTVTNSLQKYTMTNVDKWVSGKKKKIKTSNDKDYKSSLANYEKNKASADGSAPDNTKSKKPSNSKTSVPGSLSDNVKEKFQKH